jgi:thiol reductant ABC exporter CydC subunit
VSGPIHESAREPALTAGQVLSRLLGLLWSFKGRVALAALLGFLAIGSSVGLLATSAILISAAALQPSIADLSLAIVSVRFFGIARAVFRYLERLVSHTVTFRLLTRLRTWFYASLEPLAPAGLGRYRSGDMLNRIMADVETLQEFYVRAAGPPLVAVLVVGVLAGLLAIFDGQLSLALLAGSLLAGLVLPLAIHRASRRPGQRTGRLRAELQQLLVDGLQGMADLQAYGRAGESLARLNRLSQSLASAQQRLAWIDGLQAALSSLLANLTMWIILLLAIPLVHQGQIEGVYLAGLALAVLAAFEAIQPLPQAANQWVLSRESAGRLLSIVDTPPVVAEPCPVPAPEPRRPDIKLVAAVLTATHLRLDGLGFRYGPDQPWALWDIDLDLPPGKNLAVVGPSGAGKSSLINVLLRFWPYESGQVWLDDWPLASLSGEVVRRHFAVVGQDSYLFNASIWDNIRLARPAANPTEIETAAERAQLRPFIESLPDGYQTLAGDRGLQLSGGQRQRLVLARALLRQSPILILDEPTANLDPLTEQQVLRTVFKWVKGRSLLLITHRLVGLEKMDEIVVLDRGRIVERGRQEELLQHQSLFARLWRLQHQAYLKPKRSAPLPVVGEADG